MANNENTAKLKFAALKNEADSLGITYQKDITEETLKFAVDAAKEALGKKPVELAPATAKAVVDEDMATKMGAAIGKELAKANKQAKADADGQGEETYEEPGEDEIGELKTYYTMSAWWILPGKRVAGRTVKAPYGKIKFELSHSGTIRHGNQNQTQYVSIFITDNKKVQAHLETHESFGKLFFIDSPKVGVSTDQMLHAQEFGRQMKGLENTQAKELHATAAALGIPLSHDMSLNTLRTGIAEKRTQAILLERKFQQEQVNAKQGRESLISEAQNT